MLSCHDICFHYPDASPLFKDFSISFRDGKISAVLGPSGCGKTTLLHLLSGLVQPDAGSIEGLRERRISYLFQEPRLLPWMTALDNVLLVNPDRDRARRFLTMLDLKDSEGLYPGQLSGGMRQRLAMARAFAYQAPLLLMDEPFQALDIALRISLIDSFRGLWLEEARTALFVTHDIQEALLLGDDIFILRGRPAESVQSFKNPIADARERYLGSDSLMELESQLYSLLLP